MLHYKIDKKMPSKGTPTLLKRVIEEGKRAAFAGNFYAQPQLIRAYFFTEFQVVALTKGVYPLSRVKLDTIKTNHRGRSETQHLPAKFANKLKRVKNSACSVFAFYKWE